MSMKLRLIIFLKKRGSRCPRCFGTPKKTQELYEREVSEIGNGEYEVLGNYKGNRVKIKMKHKKCGRTYKVEPSSFLRGRRCPHCYGNVLKTLEEFLKEVDKLGNNEYEVLGNYKNNKTKIKMKHSICNSIYDVRPNDFLNGRRCPRCNESKGEKAVSSFLDSLSISYERQKREIIDSRNFYFDFYLTELKMAIEYNGVQHYESIDFFGGDKGLQKTLERDRIKSNYCIENDIQLIIIKYDEIIEEKLAFLNKML